MTTTVLGPGLTDAPTATYQVPADHIGASYYNVMLADASQYATEVLDRLERDCERLGTVEYERDVAVGSAGTSIVGAAADRGADEIVIGSRGVGRMRALMGSVAHDVIHRASCPVTVIPEHMVELYTETPAATASAV
jgi:nucleotide-binding universal stress UspA family protein